MELLSKYYKLSIFTHEISRDTRTIVCNTGNGKHVRIPTECWEVIKQNIVEYTPREVCDAAYEEDRDYYIKIYDKLLEAKLLVLPDEEHIKEVYLTLTNRCNLCCTHCCADAANASGDDSLSAADWIKIIDILIAKKVERIVLTGGEPLLRSDFFEILDYLNDNFTGLLGLSTNGLLINENNVKKLVGSFATISISLDGYDEESCSKIRGKGVFTKVINNIKMLIENGCDPNLISVSMVETAVTCKGKDTFKKLCEELNIRSVIRKFSPTGRGKENAKWLQLEEEKVFHGLYTEDEELRSKLNLSCFVCQNCTAGRTRVAVNEQGNVFPCDVLDMEEYCMGNLLEDEGLLDTIWASWASENVVCKSNKGLEKFKKLIIKNNEKCSKCDVAPFCIMCFEAHLLDREEYGIDAICSANKEYLGDIIWKE